MSQSVTFWAFTKQSMARATRQYFAPFVKTKETKELEKLLEATKNHVMSAEEKEEQRRSFAHGNVALHNPAVTREVIDRAAERNPHNTYPCEYHSENELGVCRVCAQRGAKTSLIHAAEEEESRIKILSIKAVEEMLESFKVLKDEIARLKKLVEAADYLQHCRRSQAEHPYSTVSVAANKKRVERASEHYDFLRGQVKL